MPIFEYHCQGCANDFEQIVFNSKAQVKCPKCRSGKVKKKMSAFAIKSGSKFVAASGSGGGCGSCSGHHCGTCH